MKFKKTEWVELSEEEFEEALENYILEKKGTCVSIKNTERVYPSITYWDVLKNKDYFEPYIRCYFV